jgi:hypothetical protein
MTLRQLVLRVCWLTFVSATAGVIVAGTLHIALAAGAVSGVIAFVLALRLIRMQSRAT